ncbi:MAG TPA: VOC family protein [Candidatus Limnocylindria bacterium]|jgi:PhnB protein|nr:VOC family protein [Candidatus Limnocylindria bacterium]
MPSRLNPYLGFNGEAREAMDFYHDVFGGELTSQTYAEGGMSEGPDDANLVMHAQLDAPNGMTLMGSDAPPRMGRQERGGMSISLSGDDDGELSGYWQKLSDGGSVTMPLEAAPWGDKFGMLTDRFGVEWMVNIAGSPPGSQAE